MNKPEEEAIKQAEKDTTMPKIYSGTDWGVFRLDDLLSVLGRTIKKDDTNKVLVFLCQLLAFTEDDQLNIAFTSPSSSGKSYLALEIASLFPSDAIIDSGYASPASFFHLNSKYNKETKTYSIDLERKILIFLDMPHFQLLERLRSLFSHDKKVIKVKIVDKQKSGITTKEIDLIGHSSVIFCSSSFSTDEQEQTRFLFLSPEVTQEKIRSAVHEVFEKNTDPIAYYRKLNSDPKRKELIQRIEAIREEKIKVIKLHDRAKLEEMFFKRNKMLKPRHSRDAKRICNIIKGFALLNLWHRNYNEEKGEITTTNEDYENGFKIWDEIAVSQDLGIAPYLLNIFKEIILPLYQEKGGGLTRAEVLKQHFKIYGRHLQDFRFRKEYLPMLENSGLIYQEQSSDDGRVYLIFPLVDSTIVLASKEESESVEIPDKY